MYYNNEYFSKTEQPLIHATKNYLTLNQAAANHLQIKQYDEIAIERNVDGKLYLAVVTNTEKDGFVMLRKNNIFGLVSYCFDARKEFETYKEYVISEIPLFDKKRGLDWFLVKEFDTNCVKKFYNGTNQNN